MLNKIVPKRLATANCLNLKIDRIIIFVENIDEIEAFRALHFYYFEFAMCNLEKGIISSIFFLREVNLELVWINNQESAFKYAAQNNLDFSSLVQQGRNRVVPLTFILSYSSARNPQSKRRCYHTDKQEINRTQAAPQVNFSLSNLKNLQEPACYIVPESLTSENFLDSSSVVKRNLLFHQSKTRILTDIRVTLDSPEPLSKAISLISSLEFVEIKRGEFPKLELIFNNSDNRRFFITPFSSIPVIFYY